MTDALEGRAFVSYTWELDPDITSGKQPYHNGRYAAEEDYVPVEHTHVVPNGKWVLERDFFEKFLLVGVQPNELQKQVLMTQNGYRRVLCTADKPFGFIIIDRSDPGRKQFDCARQIHKGEYGKSAPIPPLTYIEEAPVSSKDPNAPKHGPYGWIRLTELATAVDLPPYAVAFGYWEFSGHYNSGLYYKSQLVGTLLDIVVASSPEQITQQTPRVRYATKTEADDLIQQSVEDLWVRRGFAYTVLRLSAFGVRPLIIQPA